MKPVICVTHAAFDEQRRHSLNRLTAQLRTEAPYIPFHVMADTTRAGSLWCWRAAMDFALARTDATHIVWLPDDAIVCRDFGLILHHAIKARPDDVFDCNVNHSLLLRHRVKTPWYSTPDGFLGFGGVFPRAELEAHLRWRDERPELGDYTNDGGVNLWAADTGRLIYKTAWTLVRHDLTVPSLDGHDGQAAEGHIRDGLHWVDDARVGVREDKMNFLIRSFMASDEENPGFARAATALPRTYATNVFDIVRRLRPEHWHVDAMYAAYEPPPERGERIIIVVPRYHEDSAIVEATDPSREAVLEDLHAHGIEAIVVKPPGESHVDRMRQRATHLALKMGATRLLWWDADIRCLTPECVRAMLASGHDVVAGACPFRDGTGRVVCNLLPETEVALRERQGELSLDGGCIEVMHAGTGFMMVSRKALTSLMEAYPDRLHLSRGKGDEGEPLWALWDANMVGAEYPDDWAKTVRSRAFETEDWFFCRLWQEQGGKVYVYVPARFTHIGTHEYEGSFEQQWGLVSA